MKVKTSSRRRERLPKSETRSSPRCLHELRTPLAGIKAYVELLIDGEAQDHQTAFEFYEVIQDEANRLGQLIDDILSISRIEAGVARVQTQSVDIHALLREAHHRGRVRSRSGKTRLFANFCATQLIETSADRDMPPAGRARLCSQMQQKFSPVGGLQPSKPLYQLPSKHADHQNLRPGTRHRTRGCKPRQCSISSWSMTVLLPIGEARESA